MSLNLANLLPPSYCADAVRWLEEDCPSFDIGGLVVGEKAEVAHILCKNECVLAGTPFVNAILDHLGLQVSWNCPEGSSISCADNGSCKVVVATVTGPCCKILLAERTCLNILSRASGVATAAHRVLQVKQQAAWAGHVAGTRKTTPGFRMVEKYALLVGGVATHRMDLSQMVMLKDNHVRSAGSITKALQAAKTAAGFSVKIEVECQSVEEGLEAASAGADIVMLDNFTAPAAQAAAQEIKRCHPSVLIEVSGGISEGNMAAYMSSYVDIISCGALTQGKPRCIYLILSDAWHGIYRLSVCGLLHEGAACRSSGS